jgi:hypothetical protein
MRTLVSLLAAGLAWVGAPAVAQAPAAPDYAQEASWLCLPGRIDACATDQSVTVVEANGRMRAEALVPDADPKFDCFYVYPTVSNDPGGNSDMTANAEELRVAHAQAARFRQHCRVFAPLYRQVTLTALRAAMAGGSQPAPDRALAFRDVAAAWQHYLTNHNQGRGVVLIGHSQGSGMLNQLLKTMAAPAERARIVSALLIGTNVVRSDSDPATGDFPWMPVCTRADQHGCLVSFVTFRADVPPPANSRFGKTDQAGSHVVCVNPAQLLGRARAAHAIFSTGGVGTSSKPMTEWVRGKPLPTTNFVAVPGLIRAECTRAGGASYLAVAVNANRRDPRVDDITGDVFVGDRRLDDWGLHLIDMPVVMGDLVALTKRQHASWAAAR